jgi:predicted nucleic acid-binding protein
VSLVVDASIALSWCFQDERTDAIVAILRRVAVAGAIVPALWRLEVLSGLQVAVRRGRIDSAYRNASLSDLLSLAIAIDPDTNRQAWSATLHLSDRFGLTPYDASYLELARRRELPLATLDAALARAAHADNVPLVGVR